uniref:efflux RND transporter periplasmic adaptor subunit n=1 Tax=Sandarakinorhabdus sp. TaxID=1916663 RepID=UPI0028A78FC9
MFRHAAQLLIAAALTGCGQPAPDPAPQKVPQIAARTAIAAAAPEMTLAQLPATVVQPPGARVAVATPFAGLVRSVHVQPGQTVEKGQLLAVIVSRDAMALAAELAQAESSRRLTAAEAARMAELARAGVVAASRADAAAAASNQDDITVRTARSMIDQASVGRDGTIRLTAPIAGRISSMAMDAGSAVDAMSAPIVIEREGSRWLALQVPERLALAVRAGLPVSTDDGQTGRMETVASSLDPATRAFAARARLADGGPPLVGGRLLRLTIRAPAPAGAISVPAAAIATENGKDLVFVRTSAGFVARPVTRAGSGDPAVIT